MACPAGLAHHVLSMTRHRPCLTLCSALLLCRFTYRYLVFGPDREELVASAKAFVKKVYGK